MITFCSSILIQVSPEVVFDMLANVHRVRQAEDSPVRTLDLTTPGPPGVGSRYYEVVRMLPFYDGEIISEITAFEPPRLLEEIFTGPGMTGRLKYQMQSMGEATLLTQQQCFSYRGLLRLCEPIIRIPLFRRLRWRLGLIKQGLEKGLELEEEIQ